MATTPYPFVASTVLTASKLNSTFNIPVSTKTTSYVFVAADGGTRVVMNAAGSTTLTVNTSLFSAGDSVQIHNIGAGVTTITAGTATVTSAGPLAIPQYGGGTLFFTSASAAIFFPFAVTASAGALTFISGTNLTGSSVTVTNCFSATYDNYAIFILNVKNTSGTDQVLFRLGSSSTLTYNTTYHTPGSGFTNYSSGTNASSVTLAGTNSTEAVNTIMTVGGPYLANNTIMNAESTQATQFFGCQMNDQSTTQFTSLTLSLLTGTFSSGKIYIYGYANS